MRITLYLFLLFSLFVFSAHGEGEYDREGERAKMLDQIENGWKGPKLQFINYRKATPINRALADHYRKHIFPIQNELSKLNTKRRLLKVALDRALYLDEAEKKAWQERSLMISKRRIELVTGEGYFAAYKKWRDMTKGHKTDFAKEIRRAFNVMKRDRLAKSDISLIEEFNALNIKEQEVRNDSPFGRNISEVNKKEEKIKGAYGRGEISFSEMVDKVKTLIPEGNGALGVDVINRGKDVINRKAVVMTELARRSGFSSWADYISSVGTGYADELADFSYRKKFLRDVLTRSKPEIVNLYEQVKKDIPELAAKSVDEISSFELGLLRVHIEERENLEFRDYVLPPDVEKHWKQTMLDSGFDSRTFDHVTLDVLPREGKHTHAYMMPARLRTPKIYKFDVETMKWKYPKFVSSRSHHDPIIHIVQNFHSGSSAAIRSNYDVAFHEGGHAIDFSHRLGAIFGNGSSSSAYTETPSKLMERFLLDDEWVRAHYRHKTTGLPPTMDIIVKERNKINMLLALKLYDSFSTALFDMELWDRPYSEDSETFIERAARLQGEMHSEFTPGALKRISDDIPRVAFRFFTDHHTSGSVGYIGYGLAEIASSMVAKKMYADLEASTGRRSLYKQPTIARRLVELFQTGHLYEFPNSVEKFTGEKFALDRAQNMISERIANYVDARARKGGGGSSVAGRAIKKVGRLLR